MPNPDLTPAIRSQLEEVIAQSVETFLTEFTSKLFPDYATSDAQDCVAAGIALGIGRYQRVTGRPIADTIVASLNDLK